ncbi:hypothetical protein SAMN05216266_101487 [Amycolatopsis marina]|uniref:DUF6802 domain-containing protein n=1 Tax=Amycolatopsis marina TaxID=490629 RepID=A0A1I0VUJ0_9PSEU|nr:DUF6802 family protein [Amycolatopsis marina]SFA79697.1 hypothetical protein SAMN05216266_101487 [Amycolatopsis marina]
MWVDESGATDTTGTTGSSDEITVTVEGEEYVAEINFDIDEDGVDDTAIIEHADGTGQAFVDVDGDGQADEYIQLDAQGDVLTHAEYDEASGDWVSVEPGSGDSGDTQTGSSGPMTADLPDGQVEVGPATVDTNDDGINDTAVVQDETGTTTAFTDVDSDGEADVAVIIDQNGGSTSYEHTGDGEWTELDTTSNAVGVTGVAAGASDAAWGAEQSGTEQVEGVARIDSATGQWISQN